MAPKLIYDDDCNYCTWATEFAVKRSDIEPVRLSDVRSGESSLTEEERDRLHEGYEECAQLIADEAVYSCGAATEQSFVRAGVLPEEYVSTLREYAGYVGLREALYHFMSNHRDVWSEVFYREPPVEQQ